MTQLQVTGTPTGAGAKARFRVDVDGRPVALTGNSFRILATLALASGQWVKAEALDEYNATRYVWRLRKEAEAFGVSLPIDNDRGGAYRLPIKADAIKIDLAGVRRFGDARLTALIEEGAAA